MRVLYCLLEFSWYYEILYYNAFTQGLDVIRVNNITYVHYLILYLTRLFNLCALPFYPIPYCYDLACQAAL